MSASSSTRRTRAAHTRHLSVVGPETPRTEAAARPSLARIVPTLAADVVVTVVSLAVKTVRRRTPGEHPLDHPALPQRPVKHVTGPHLLAVVSPVS